MSKLTVIIGVALVVLGVGGYLATGRNSATALIPAGFGLLYIILGVVGEQRPGARMHVMHVAALLSLIGIGGNVTAIAAVLRGDAGTAAVLRTIMAGICALHLVLAIRSFVLARVRPAT
jgi:hypothetical protein